MNLRHRWCIARLRHFIVTGIGILKVISYRATRFRLARVDRVDSASAPAVPGFPFVFVRESRVPTEGKDIIRSGVPGGDWPGRMICCPKDLHRFLTIGEEKSSPCICLPDLQPFRGGSRDVTLLAERSGARIRQIKSGVEPSVYDNRRSMSIRMRDRGRAEKSLSFHSRITFMSELSFFNIRIVNSPRISFENTVVYFWELRKRYSCTNERNELLKWLNVSTAEILICVVYRVLAMFDISSAIVII